MGAGFGGGGRREFESQSELLGCYHLWEFSVEEKPQSRCGDEASRYQPRTLRAAPGVTVIDKKRGREGWPQSSG